MDEAERRARREELERNYDKTLQEVILRSRLEAERHEADRLRKLMLDTAMAEIGFCARRRRLPALHGQRPRSCLKRITRTKGYARNSWHSKHGWRECKRPATE